MIGRAVRWLLVCGACVFGAAPAGATFSVVISDRETGEVAFASVTCLTGEDLMALVPVIVVGKGAGAAQAFGDAEGERRPIIFDGLNDGTTPEEIVALLSAVPGHDFRQYGIVDTTGAHASFSGPFSPRWRGGVSGTDGSLAYSIQGNALAGECVVEAMEAAITNLANDVPTRLMAAMQAAFESGGDGRCSCATGDPDGCSCPPEKFDKVGHIGGIVVARIGDTDDPECDADGCADGDYFIRFNVAFQNHWDPDPVQQLQTQYSIFRAVHVGRPDAVHSTATFSPPEIPANGVSTTSMVVRLRDWRHVSITSPLTEISVEHTADSAGISSINAVIDNGDGTATVKITAGQAAGIDRFRVVVDDGIRQVTVMPDPSFAFFQLGDVDGDGSVNTLDLLEILVAWGECAPPPAACMADLDADGFVGFADLLILLQGWS